VIAVHDCSDGGLLVAAAEMAFAGTSQERRLGLELDLAELPGSARSLFTRCFNESPSRYLLQVHEDDVADVMADLAGLPHAVIGTFNTSGRLTLAGNPLDEDLDDLRERWRAPLDWTTPAAHS
jgi:phosphoribosylformylglycinamidine (FGAM) synthase-like enzyme